MIVPVQNTKCLLFPQNKTELSNMDENSIKSQAKVNIILID